MLRDGSNPEGVDPSPPLEWTRSTFLDEGSRVVLANNPGSPPTAKIRYHLSYWRVPYTAQKAKEFYRGKTKGVDYTKVPAIRVRDRQVNDSYIILKNLVPALWGVPFDDAWERKLTFGFQLAMEVEIFGDRSQWKPALRNFGYPAFLATLCPFIVPFKRISTNVKAARTSAESVARYGPLRPAREYLAEFRSEMGAQPFFGGDEPGPVDVSLYGTLAMWHPGIPGTVDMLADCDLQAWWGRMVEKMPKQVVGNK